MRSCSHRCTRYVAMLLDSDRRRLQRGRQRRLRRRRFLGRRELNSGSYEASEFNYVDPYPPGFHPVLRLNSIRPT
jgi:hypothetical protein